MKTTMTLSLILTGLVTVVLIGCDIGTNPLIFDGTATTGKLRIDQTDTVFATSASVDLNAVRNAISEDIDSVHFYNLTILIDSTTGTPAGTTISGLLTVVETNNQSHTIDSLSNVPISAFRTERSIFDTTIAGWRYNDQGVAFLIISLRNPNPPTVTFKLGATANQGPLHFTVIAKVYAQVFTKPSK